MELSVLLVWGRYLGQLALSKVRVKRIAFADFRVLDKALVPNPATQVRSLDERWISAKEVAGEQNLESAVDLYSIRKQFKQVKSSAA